jgi:osmoprotectant transport system substrate-binding protein
VKTFVAGIAAFILAGCLVGRVPSTQAEPVIVASKIDTEGALLGNIIVILLRRNGIEVTDKIQLGPTPIVRRALLAGQIDLYPEYTGNGAVFFAREADPVWHDGERGYEEVKKLDRERNNLVWLAASPANNSWAVAVRDDFAQAEKLATMEDFAAYIHRGGRIKLAASAEFVESPGALPAFEAAYGFTLARNQLLSLVGGNTAATIRAAAESISGVNAAMAYGTDGALAALGLVILADDKGAQTVYRPAPVIRAAVLALHPNIATILDPVFRSLTLERLQALNARIAVDGDDPEQVASDYLATNGFLQ